MKTIILNHKGYLTYDEIKKYKNELEKINNNKVNLVLMPNLAYISMFEDYKIKIGAQNFYSYNLGSYTGEIPLESLKSMNIKYTLVGHPERITLKLDSYEEIKEKLYRSLNSGFKTILCIGHDEKLATVKKELKYYLKTADYIDIKNLIIAYEPSSKIETEEVNLKDINYLNNFIKEYFMYEFEEEVPFLYGGSVTSENINEILKITDGVIIGKNSTNITQVKEILNKITK